MDRIRFEALTRTLSSRRLALRGLFGGLVGLLGLAVAAAPASATASNGASRSRFW